jgi:quaternary ammonium compound-resistance protein SugE
LIVIKAPRRRGKALRRQSTLMRGRLHIESNRQPEPRSRRKVYNARALPREVRGAIREPFRMHWTYLIVAGVLEIVWAIGLKYTEGFTKLVPSLVTGVALVASMVFLALALRAIPVGTGYAIWTGIGAVGTAILGIVLFAEPATLARLGCIGLIVAGIVGLKLVTPT